MSLYGATEECNVCKLPYKFILSMGSQASNTPRNGEVQRHENFGAYKQNIIVSYRSISRTDFEALLQLGMYPKVKQKCQQHRQQKTAEAEIELLTFSILNYNYGK